MCVLVLSHFSHVWLCVTPWTAAHQAPLSMGFSRQEYWSGLPCPPPGDFPHPGIKPMSLINPALAGRFFATHDTWESLCISSHHSLKDMQVAAVILTWKSDSCSPRNDMAFTEGLVMVYYGLPELIIAISQMLLIFNRDFSSNGILVVSWYTWIWWCLCIWINCYVIFIVSE